jgi:hypothetical protein
MPSTYSPPIDTSIPNFVIFHSQFGTVPTKIIRPPLSKCILVSPRGSTTPTHLGRFLTSFTSQNRQPTGWDAHAPPVQSHQQSQLHLPEHHRYPTSSPDVEILLDIPLSISSPSVLSCHDLLQCVLSFLGFQVCPVLSYKSECLDSLLLCVLNIFALSLSLFLYTVPEIVP